MKKVFIVGTTEYSFMIHSMIKQEGQYDVVGHTVNEKYIRENEDICKKKGTCLYPFEKLHDFVCASDSVYVVNTVGYSNMNRTRQKMYEQCIDLRYNPVNYISNRAICLSEIKGSGNIIFPGAYIGTNIDMGNNNVVYAGVVLTHDIVVGDHNFIAANSTVGGVVHVGNNCFIGMGSVIRNRVNISDYTLIGAGTYLDLDTGKEDVIVPPRAIKIKKKSSEVHLIPQRK